MCEHLVRLNGEAKVLRRFGDPILDGRLFYQLAERVVDLDSIQFRRVEVQKFFLRKFLRIESGLPCRISPSGSANVEMRHMVCFFRATAVKREPGLYLATIACGSRLRLCLCLLQRLFFCTR